MLIVAHSQGARHDIIYAGDNVWARRKGDLVYEREEYLAALECTHQWRFWSTDRQLQQCGLCGKQRKTPRAELEPERR